MELGQGLGPLSRDPKMPVIIRFCSHDMNKPFSGGWRNDACPPVRSNRISWASSGIRVEGCEVGFLGIFACDFKGGVFVKMAVKIMDRVRSEDNVERVCISGPVH